MTTTATGTNVETITATGTTATIMTDADSLRR